MPSEEAFCGIRPRRFYERAGYHTLGRIPDYYKPKDDCIFYCKVF